MNPNSLANKQKQKQANKQKKIEFQLTCKIHLFVPCNGNQNCLDKYLLTYHACYYNHY